MDTNLKGTITELKCKTYFLEFYPRHRRKVIKNTSKNFKK